MSWATSGPTWSAAWSASCCRSRVSRAIVLVACGAIQNFSGIHEVGQFMGGSQQWNGGAVASQEAIKELGTNGGGYFNANSAHPFENPTPFTNLFEIFLLLVIPFSLTRTFGRMVGIAASRATRSSRRWPPSGSASPR